MKIAYLGDEYSFSFLAAKTKGSGNELVGFPTITAALSAVKNGEVVECVAPIENSVEGSVNETLDGINNKSLYITGEINQKIEHRLIANIGAEKSGIKTIYSHAQALSQCRNYLENNFKNAELVPTVSTSKALELVALDKENKTIAAIVGIAKSGQITLEENIQDYENNTTRFVTISKSFLRTGNKVSIVFDTANESGALLKALSVFSSQKLNMTKIESRPSKAVLGKYIFFVDFIFNGDFLALNKLFSLIQESGITNLKFLGLFIAA